MSRILLLEWSHKNLGSATSHLFFLICIGFRFATELALKLLRLLSECSNFSSHPILHLSSQSMYRREHSALLQLCQYVFLHVKPPSQPPNHFHLLLQISGTHCQIICHPFQLFLLSEELSNITYSCLLTLTVVRNLVRSNQLNVSRFVIQRQLLPSHSPEIPCRPSKGVPSERLRLVKWFISHRLHGACVNLVLLTYLVSAAIRNELHWLPIGKRIQFKIALVRHCIVGAAPEYLTELCRPVSSSSGRQSLRSVSRGDLVVPRFRLRRSGYRAFAVSGPHVWNSLPTEIRQSCNNLLQLKSKLKTFCSSSPEPFCGSI